MRRSASATGPGYEPVHRVLVARVAELDDDVVERRGQPRVGEQHLQRVVMVCRPCDSPMPTSRCLVKASRTVPFSSRPAGGHGLKLVSHAVLQLATVHAADAASTLSQLPHGQ